MAKRQIGMGPAVLLFNPFGLFPSDLSECNNAVQYIL
jgi:hypothetical protein